MSHKQRKTLRDAIKLYRRNEQTLRRAEQALADAKRDMQNAYGKLDEIAPRSEPAVIRFGPKTLVVYRDRCGLGNVQISDAAVA